MLNRYCWLLMLALQGCCFMPAQPVYMTGQVSDAATGKPVAGAYVLIRWNKSLAPFDLSATCDHVGGAVTGLDGRYSILAFKGVANDFTTIYKQGYSVTEGTNQIAVSSGSYGQRTYEMATRLEKYMYCPSGDNDLVIKALEDAYNEASSILHVPVKIPKGAVLSEDLASNEGSAFWLKNMLDIQIEWAKKVKQQSQ